MLKINFEEAKQVLCSAVSFRRKPKAVHKVALLSTGGMVRNRAALGESTELWDG